MNKIKISIGVATLLGLAFFNRTLDRGRSPEQRAFDDWAATVSPIAAAEQAKSVTIVVRVADAQGAHSFQFSGADSTERVQRLLELLTASNIFSNLNREPMTSGGVQIEVTDADIKFQTVASSKFIASSVPTQGFLKLVTIYAGDPPQNENKK